MRSARHAFLVVVTRSRHPSFGILIIQRNTVAGRFPHGRRESGEDVFRY
nr:hypothetical protein JVH1_2549 [Rhodococcus sp. JVH1]